MTVIATPSSVVPPLVRLLAKTRVTEHGLMWDGGTNNAGYGMLYVGSDGKKRKYAPVHRFFYEQSNGPVDKEYDVHHECHRRRCLTHLAILPKRINRMMQLHRRRYRHE